ncbi:amidophosphoribosyltransferase [Baekduia alba]|uniref:amidophosphoribosyltransferase n=1 Tax=Baekduia alba TaxID=2997333 RepID=UPI0032C3F526
MCGISALFAKSSSIERELGGLLAGMLHQLVERGPDSAGVALYRDPVATGTKLSLLSSGDGVDWVGLAEAMGDPVGASSVVAEHGDHAVLRVEADADAARAWLAEHVADVAVIASGQAIELHKRAGLPTSLLDRCGIRALDATHGLGHTRMATESRVTTAGSHPFSTGEDLCLVHNGSLSNHNRLRRELRRQGVTFATENDSEVAAGYLMWRLREGDPLNAALEAALEDLDGFFTFAVGTRDGFAVLRDPIACKPAVMAETDDWVAMATEYRAIATLPGAADAVMWEPEPAKVYSWSRAEVAA